MRILVDLDDVLINTGETWVDVLNERHGTTVKYSDITEWGITKFFPTLTPNEVFEPLSDGSVWSRVSPIDGARDTLEHLMLEGDDVYIVTSSHLETIGKKWTDVIQKFFPIIDVSKVIVTEHKQMIMGDVLVDDAPFNFYGYPHYFGILFDKPHNAWYDIKDNDGLGYAARAKNWNEVYELIREVREEYFGGEMVE